MVTLYYYIAVPGAVRGALSVALGIALIYPVVSCQLVLVLPDAESFFN